MKKPPKKQKTLYNPNSGRMSAEAEGHEGRSWERPRSCHGSPNLRMFLWTLLKGDVGPAALRVNRRPENEKSSPSKKPDNGGLTHSGTIYTTNGPHLGSFWYPVGRWFVWKTFFKRFSVTQPHKRIQVNIWTLWMIRTEREKSNTVGPEAKERTRVFHRRTWETENRSQC